MKRLGVTGNISAEKLTDFFALKQDVFVENGNINLIKSNFRQKINEASGLGFIPKGVSKKNQNYKNIIEQKREENYLGKWYRDGWFSQRSTSNDNITFSYTDNLFYNRDLLPYTNSTSTGLYINEHWSGLNFKFDSSKYVIGGFVNAATFDDTSLETSPFPYKNFNEIFDHSGVQIGDMGAKIAYTETEINNFETLSGDVIGYQTGQSIGYNRIFFLSGLNRSNIRDYDYKMLLIPDKNKFNKKKNITSFGKNLGQIEEQADQPRYNVFFYTGNLDIQYTPIITSKPNTLGYGETYAKGSSGLFNLNSGFNIKCSGTYPQFFTKDFYIYNTGVLTQDFYVQVSNTGIIEINSDIQSKPSVYKFINEQSGLFSGQDINLYSLGKDGVGYFTAKIYTKDITGDIVSNIKIQNENIYLYRATGEFTQNNITGLKNQTFSIPVNLNINYNNAEIFSDDYFFDFTSGSNYKAFSKKGQPVGFNNLGITNKNNKFFGLTLYATGGILENQIIKNDLNKKIYKLEEYSSTGVFRNLKTIYPLKIAETYYFIESNVDWIKNLNSSYQIFRWISGFSGFFDNRTFNPISGSIQQDVRLVIDTENILPKKDNISGANFTVKLESGNITFNGLTGILNLKRDKKYRFLQVNTTNSTPFSINSSQTRTFEPEYNKQILNNYRLIDFNPNLNTSNTITWTAGTGYSGSFRIINNENLPDYSYQTGLNLTGENKNYRVYNYNGTITENITTTGSFQSISPLKFQINLNDYKLRRLTLEKNKSYIFQTIWPSSATRNKAELVFWTGSETFSQDKIYNFSNSKRLWASNNVDLHLFDIPNNTSINQLYIGVTGFGKVWANEADIIEDQNFVETTGRYINITTPIFSGNLNIYTSNISENFSIPFILSGISGFDNINF